MTRDERRKDFDELHGVRAPTPLDRPSPVSEEQIAELLRLAEAATPGPWLAGRPDGGPGVIPSGLDDAGWPHLTIYTHSMADAAFIAAAREAVPALAAALAVERTENERLRAALATIQRWDCLNPPDPKLLSDLPWLRKLVDAALLSAP